VKVVGNLFTGNSAIVGGGIYLIAGGFLANNTIVDNVAERGGGKNALNSSELTVTNSIFWGNQASDDGDQLYFIGVGNALQLSYSVLEGGMDGVSGSIWEESISDSLNLELDPLFVGSGDDPYSLQYRSSCIGSGTRDTTGLSLPDLDLKGDARIHSGLLHDYVDMGAYEHPGDGFEIHFDTDWSRDTLHVQDEIVVHPTAVLTVQPGSVVKVQGTYALEFSGSLLAEGSLAQPILFTAQDPQTGWRGLRFVDSPDTMSSNLEWCTLEYGVASATRDAADGGLLYLENCGGLTLRSSILRHGLAARGGGVFCDSSSLTMINCVVADCEATGDGGGIYLEQSSPDLRYITVSAGAGGNGGILACTQDSDPVILGSILWSANQDALYLSPGEDCDPDITYSDVAGGYAGAGNQDGDPGFIGGGAHPWAATSAICLNAGHADTLGLELPALDPAGNPRVHEHIMPGFDRVDMGAYEHQGLAVPVVSASDGDNDYPGFIRVEFTYRDDYMPLEGFEIYRDDVLTYIAAPGETYYDDHDASPGQVYSYRVRAYAGTEAAEAEDSGYMRPNGVITGSVLTANGNPVSGVRISLDPSPGYCLEFGGGDSLLIPEPDLDPLLDSTQKLWLRTTQSDVTILGQADRQLRITAAGEVEYKNETASVVQSDLSVLANDGAWHHLALSHDAGEDELLIYLDAAPVGSGNGVFSPGGWGVMHFGAGFSGSLDELRLWSTVRDSTAIAENRDRIVSWSEPGLEGYWTLNEGTGIVAFDATQDPRNGAVHGAAWSDQQPGIELAAYTNFLGDYAITEINYGYITTFTATPYKEGHVFLPEQRQVTLSESNISQDNVDFTDNSMIPISGTVSFQSTGCRIEGVNILLNGAPAAPPGITDENGEYLLEVEHGTSCLLSAEYLDHQFDRTWDLGAVTYPVIDVDFADVTRTHLRVDVVGGAEGWPIGDFDVRLSTLNGCYRDTLLAEEEQWETGGIWVSNLPPLDYFIDVSPGPQDPFNLAVDAYFESIRSDSISLTYADSTYDTLRFEWRAPLQASVTWPESIQFVTTEGDSVTWPVGLQAFDEYPDSSFYVLPQTRWCYTGIRALEDYSWTGHPEQFSYLETCTIQILDEVGTSGEVEGTFPDTTVAYHNFAPFLPNMLSGYPRQYQNKLQVTLHDPDLDRYSVNTDWVLTEGEKPLEATFATTSPELPFLVLHDPPGDGSSASFTQSSSYTSSWSWGMGHDMNANVWTTVSLGPDITSETGSPFWAVELEVDVTLDLSASVSAGMSQSEQYEQTLTFTTTQSYSTSGDDQVIGEGSDLFIGGAVNLIFGITQVLDWVDSLNTVAIDSALLMNSDGFATQYVYTKNQVENTVIPNLEAIGDTVSVEVWQQVLARNQATLENPGINENHPQNLSFNAGAEYGYEETTSVDSTATFNWDQFIGGEVGFAAGVVVNGVGVVGGSSFGMQFNWGQSQSYQQTNTSTFSFTLADDDETSELNELADYFTVDIGKDTNYGTPVFNLVSGASSCPWEENTQPRDGVDLSANTYAKYDVSAEEPALFVLTLGNTSQSGEDRMYYVGVLQESNPTGAVVYINGVPLEDAMPFAVSSGGAVQAVMTVERGPLSYELEDLAIELSSGCEGGEGPAGHYFSMTREFDITWQAPYSRVAIALPEPGLDWLINQASGNQLEVRLTGYDADHENLESLRLQYRRLPATEWNTAVEVPRDSLAAWGDTAYHNITWNVEALADGDYQLRATAFNGVQGEYATDPLDGLIDRLAPELLGQPEPADGVLEPGDAISVAFVEELDAAAFEADSVSVVKIRDGSPVPVDVDVFENTITLTPNIANYWIENELLRARVSGAPDLAGNPGELVEWEFLVNRSPVFWNTTRFDEIKPLGEPLLLCAELINEGGQACSFTITDAPDWLEPIPASGTVPALDAVQIEFLVSDELDFGSHADTVYADIPSLGREPLIFSIDVLPDPPAWAYTDFSGYDYSMDFVAVLDIEDLLSEDTADLVGAFVDVGGHRECRGATTVDYVDYLPPEYHAYLAFLTVYSDSPAGEDLAFRVWDASSNREYHGIEESHAFAADALVGNQLAPATFTVTGVTLREIDCTAGWNWISLNLADPIDNSPDGRLSSLTPATDDLLKSQREYAQYVDGFGWLGSLDSLRILDAYKLQLAQSDTLELTGLPGDPALAPLSIASGWNWIGYTPQVSYSVNQAFSGLPGPDTGDLVKGQDGFALYIEGQGWFGSLGFLHPGRGYMLNTQGAGEFSYPGWGARLLPLADPVEPPIQLRDAPDWSVDPADFEFTASVTAQVWRDGAPADSNLMVGAFVGGECRGVATPMNVLDTWLVFLTVYANANGETIDFEVYFESTDEILPVQENMVFINNDVSGTPLDPFLLHALPAPEAPAHLSILYSDNQLVLSWEEAAGAASYRVYASAEAYGLYQDVTGEGSFGGGTRDRRQVVTWTTTLPAETRRFYRVTSESVAAGAGSGPRKSRREVSAVSVNR